MMVAELIKTFGAGGQFFRAHGLPVRNDDGGLTSAGAHEWAAP